MLLGALNLPFRIIDGAASFPPGRKKRPRSPGAFFIPEPRAYAAVFARAA
ncbi:MAG: hypothetical protein K0Q91_371 [Fibrobacteria bacterium]|jgi:hypothetical protein|nr:hypothetical protein [Fibrobacteria bacterium]